MINLKCLFKNFGNHWGNITVILSHLSFFFSIFIGFCLRNNKKLEQLDSNWILSQSIQTYFHTRFVKHAQIMNQ